MNHKLLFPMLTHNGLKFCVPLGNVISLSQDFESPNHCVLHYLHAGVEKALTVDEDFHTACARLNIAFGIEQ